MKQLIRYIAIGIILILLTNNFSYCQVYSYRSYTHRDGLQISALNAIIEMQDGGILFGTEGSGIIEYDGYKFKDVIKNDVNNNHHVTAIKIIQDDIYFTSKYRGLFSLSKNGKLTKLYTDNKQSDFNELIQCDQLLLFTNSKYLLSYNPLKQIISKLFTFNDKIIIYQNFQTPNGCVLLTNQGNYIYTKDNRFITLQKFFKSIDNQLVEAKFGYFSNGLIHLYDQYLSKELLVVMNDEGNYNSKTKKLTPNSSLDKDEIVRATFNDKKKCFSFITSNGHLYELSNGSIKSIHKNTSIKKMGIRNFICDYNGDYWATTYFTGLVKISTQPFSKLEFQPELLDEHIRFITLTTKDNIIFSNTEAETFVGNLYYGGFKKYPIFINSSTTVNEHLFLGTKEGLYEYIETTNELKKLPTLDGERIEFITYKNSYIYLSIFNKGLYKYDKNLKLIKHYLPTNNVPSIIYTGQFTDNGDILYLGTSKGVSKFDIKNEQFDWVKNHHLGEYSGLSVKDIYGTNWFTLDFGIIGFSKDGKTYVIDNPSYFPSFLFYTMNTDSYGNIILGTNKGINILKLNEEGKVLNQQNYDANSGFHGYETHMRSSYQGSSFALLGTIEGMWKIDFKVLQNLPIPRSPIISVNYNDSIHDNTRFSVSLLSKNPKLKDVFYSYRILNHSGNWSEPATKSEFLFSSLSSGEYILEARASYDGIHFSESSKETITIKQSPLQSNTLIYILISFIIVVNSIFLFKSKKNDPYEVLSTNEALSIAKYAPSLILFGLTAHVVLRVLLPLISPSFNIDPLISIPMTVLFTIFTLKARKYKRLNNDRKMLQQLSWAFSTFMLYGIYNFYNSEVHIMYAFFIILINSVAHIVFEKFKHVILYASSFLVLMILAITYTNNLNYDRYLLMVPIFISAILVVFLNIINHSSIQQLAFVSTIINKSNIIALAMNKSGQLKYISKNISNYIDVLPYDLVNKPISVLNNFTTSDTVRKTNILTDFEDGKQLITPLKNIHGGTSWIEWSCKEFAKGVKVLIGQDITDKLKIKNTYEILVENAEDLIYQIDTKGNFIFLNNRFSDYLINDKDTLNDKNIKLLIPTDYHDLIDNFLNNLIEKEESFAYIELPFYNANGELEWFGQYFTKLYSEESNSVTEILVVGRNITEKLLQDKLIATQQANITSSINYAKRIQLNLLPATDKIKGCFSEQFVYYKPKDIVSGDFYWCKQVDDYIIIAVGDGTGHGVPGAFMSILGINLLNSIVMEKNIYDPGRILDELDIRLKQMLHEGNKQRIRDGIEVTICAFNQKKGTIDYSCAGSKLIIHDGVQLSIRKGDNKHIGDDQEDFTNYITHHFDIAKETTIYLFTDGYYDQFGGVDQKKYSIRRLLELIMSNISLPLVDQKEIIENEFENWKGTLEQTDDVTIVSLRIIPPSRNN
ncbi:MAG: SpoIIE family protein phosphatase [Crocinitomicaceae bacterium]|nr:SpoIIE family protein phosphatase [Crocinitomicaceae bacterium]